MLRTLEAIVAISLLATVFIFVFKPYESFLSHEEEKLTKAFNSLKSLDKTNELRGYVLQNDTKGLEKKLRELLPEFELEVVICSTDCGKTSMPESVSITYLVAGDVKKFDPKQVIVYIR